MAEDRIDPVIVRSQNSFCVKTFQAIYAQKEGPNVFFAPLGPGTFLRFLLPFVKNSVQETLVNFLETGNRPADEIANRSAGLWIISQNKQNEEIENYSPMTVLGNAHVQFSPDFTGRSSFYKILPRSYDLTLNWMENSLQDWVKSGSNNKISEVTRYFDKTSQLVFLNGFYFKGGWSSRFEIISEGSFKNADGKDEKIPMLASAGVFQFYKDDNFEAVNIPYGTGLYSLYIFLPSDKIVISDFIKNLTEAKLSEWAGGFLERRGSVVFPQFSLESNIDLRETFKNLGLKNLFIPETNLFLIAKAPGGVFWGSMEQKAVFQTDAKTVANPSPNLPEIDASAEKDSFNFKASRPFFFILRNNKTRVITGIGAVENPSAR